MRWISKSLMIAACLAAACAYVGTAQSQTTTIDFDDYFGYIELIPGDSSSKGHYLLFSKGPCIDSTVKGYKAALFWGSRDKVHACWREDELEKTMVQVCRVDKEGGKHEGKPHLSPICVGASAFKVRSINRLPR